MQGLRLFSILLSFGGYGDPIESVESVVGTSPCKDGAVAATMNGTRGWFCTKACTKSNWNKIPLFGPLLPNLASCEDKTRKTEKCLKDAFKCIPTCNSDDDCVELRFRLPTHLTRLFHLFMLCLWKAARTLPEAPMMSCVGILLWMTLALLGYA